MPLCRGVQKGACPVIADLDPRSLRINTEMGVLIQSDGFNQTVRKALEGDFSGANAWCLELQETGQVLWVGRATKHWNHSPLCRLCSGSRTGSSPICR